ncbi:MAG TPA: WbqC family protein [Terriglobales bacterium]|nr:WbqC family protein [Terriglobales bacterium]
MRIAISQPTYLPWLGYFDLMAQVDLFVFLDSVQFEKRSWQQRNRIKTPLGLQWLTVPVVFHRNSGQEIKDVEIQGIEFVRDHLRSIEHNYRRAKFFEGYFSRLGEILQSCHKEKRLAELSVRLIGWLGAELAIHTPIMRSSTLNLPGRRSELLVNLCRSVGADSYVSPLGSAAYLMTDLELFSGAGIEITFQHYEHPVYCQLFPPFCPYASVLDLLFNHGQESSEILFSGRRAAFMPYEAGCSAVAAGGVR